MNEDKLRNGQDPEDREEGQIETDSISTPIDGEDPLCADETDVESLQESDRQEAASDGEPRTGTEELSQAEEQAVLLGRSDGAEPASSGPAAPRSGRGSLWRSLGLFVVIVLILNVMWTQMNKKILAQAESTASLRLQVEKIGEDYAAAQKNIGDMKAVLETLTGEMDLFQGALERVEGSAQRHETYLRNDLNRQKEALTEMARLVAVQEALLEGSAVESVEADGGTEEAVAPASDVMEEQLRINVETLRLTKESLEMTKAALTETEGRLEAAEARARTAEGELAALRSSVEAERSRTEEALQALTARAEKAEAELAQVAESVEASKGELEAKARAADEARVAAEAKAAELEAAVASERDRASKAENALAETEALLERARSESASGAKDREELEGKLKALGDKVAAMEEKLQASQAKLTSTEALLEAAREELKGLQKPAETAISEAVEAPAEASSPDRAETEAAVTASPDQAETPAETEVPAETEAPAEASPDQAGA